MNEISPIIDFDDPAHNPFALEEAAYGDMEDIYTPLLQLLKQAPVHQGELMTLLGAAADANLAVMPVYTVLSYKHCAEVDNDPDTYSIDAYKVGLGQTFGNTLSLLNPPEHTAIRKVFQKAFLPHIVAKWSDQLVTPVINELIDKFVGRGEADLAAEFAIKYPFEIIYRQLALPQRDIATFHKLAVSMTQIYGSYINYGREASAKLGSYFREMIAERRKRMGDDLVSLLVHAEVDGQRIPDEVIISFFRQLINAAGDTTYRGTGILLTALLRNPEQLEQVRKDRTLVSAAVEEALRWDGPTTIHNRMTTRDVVLGDLEIPRGAGIHVCTWIANHDPAVSENSVSFDIHRERKKHFAFGHGNHVCLGQHLARLEMVRALNGILDRLPNLRLDPSKEPPRIIGQYMRTPQNVNVRFGR